MSPNLSDSPKCPYIKRGAQQLRGRHRHRLAEPRQRIVNVLLHRFAAPLGIVAAADALLEQNEHGQPDPVKDLDALVEEAVHHAHQVRKRQSAEYPPAPVNKDPFQALPWAQSLQVYHGSFLEGLS